MNKLFFTTALLFVSGTALAAGAGYNTSLGQAAGNVNVILKNLSGIIEAVFYIAGAAVMVSAAMKFRIHRQTPQQVPISTVITEVVLSIILLCVPTVTKYANQHLFEEGDPIRTEGAGSRAVNEGETRGTRTGVAPVTPQRR